MEENKQDILTNINNEAELISAGQGKRFINLLIDYVTINLIIYCFSIMLLLVNPESLRDFTGEDGFNLWLILLRLLFYVFYYAMFEFITKGRTLGKFITGTRAVNEDGSNISAGTALKRSLSRLVPFEFLSAFGTPSYPWHDSWTRTYVIDNKKSFVLSGEHYDKNNSNTTSL